MRLSLVRCKSIRESKPDQIKVGKLYWIDEDSRYDLDGDSYASVYSDSEGSNNIGVLDMSHFTNYYNQLKYGLSLSYYVNETRGNLLEDIIYWCNENTNHTLSINIRKFISDHDLNRSENMQKEYLIKHISFEESIKTSKGEHISYDYGGYLLVLNE